MKYRATQRNAVAAVILAIALLAPFARTPAASAVLSFCPPGPDAGQCQNPQGLAVNEEAGRLYVADRGNNRISIFDSTGSFVKAFGWGVADGTTNALQSCSSTCFEGIAGSGAGQFSAPPWVAIDNSGGPSQGAVYVGTDNFHLQKFGPEGSLLSSFGSSSPGECRLNSPGDPIAVGPGGVIYVADSRFLEASAADGDKYEVEIRKFDSSGACIGALGPLSVQSAARALGVDSAGSIYIAYDTTGGVFKYSPSGTFLYQLDKGHQTNSIALDESDSLFLEELEKPVYSGGSHHTIAAYDSGGNQSSRFGYGEINENVTGLAVHHSAGGDVFGSEGAFFGVSRIRYLAQPPAGPLFVPSGVRADPLANANATLRAEINPEGKPTTYRIEYLPQKDFEKEGFGSVKTKSFEENLEASDFHVHGAQGFVGCPNPLSESVEGKCLTPSTEYRFRAIATNADGKDEVESTFTTKPPLEILSTYATEVGADAATLHAQVNPLGLPATGYLEYVEEATYLKDIEELGASHGFDHATKTPDIAAGEAPLDFGAGEAPLTRTAGLYPLAPDTAYRYRLVVDNPLIEPLAGPVKALSTLKIPPEPTFCPSNQAFRIGPAAYLPDCRAYELVSPLEKENGDIVVRGEATSALPAVIERASLSGEKLTYGSSRAFGDAGSSPWTSQYIASRVPGEEWRTHGISPPLGHPLEVFALDTEFRIFSPDLCRAWFKSNTDLVLAPGAQPDFADLYRRSNCGPEADTYTTLTTIRPPNVTTAEYEPELQGMSEDGETAIYVASDALTADAPALPAGSPSTRLQLYWQRVTNTAFVCILPNGSRSTQACVASTNDAGSSGHNRGSTLHAALSTNGERVFWTPYSGSGPDAGPIYLREHPGEKQSKVEAGKCTQPTRACTYGVSAKAEELSGTSASILWASSEDGSRAIFTTTGIAKPSDLYEFDLETKATTLIAHEAHGVMGASEDARWLYFASEEAIGGPNAEGRSPLAGHPNLYLRHAGTTSFIVTLADQDVESRFATISGRPSQRASRVAPDGQSAAFTSSASPFGNDNLDALSEQPDAQVYRYDAAQEALQCASCNPSGARPLGRNLFFRGGPSGRWAASYIPTWLDNFYGSRALADDGSRLYFNSTDALVARDTNGAQDVYQWEAAGTGSCTIESPAFSPPNGGCLSLISSGASPEDSRLVDASPAGNDVFFATQSSLLSQDYGLVDIYDARVDGGLPAPQRPPASCEGEACQSPPAAPDDPTPASLAFEGAGNPREAPKASCPKPKVRRKGRCVRRHAHKRHAKHKRRAKR